mmetsp:Transcript_15857/g.17121  ORF Transcript_15857/g.17121 Transcript_15857/m.17121 type:complete len:88 (+) Transcript_15857:392-655(+)
MPAVIRTAPTVCLLGGWWKLSKLIQITTTTTTHNNGGIGEKTNVIGRTLSLSCGWRDLYFHYCSAYNTCISKKEQDYLCSVPNQVFR